MRRAPTDIGLLKLGGDTEGTTGSLIDESAIRAMYRQYRETMGF